MCSGDPIPPGPVLHSFPFCRMNAQSTPLGLVSVPSGLVALSVITSSPTKANHFLPHGKKGYVRTGQLSAGWIYSPQGRDNSLHIQPVPGARQEYRDDCTIGGETWAMEPSCMPSTGMIVCNTTGLHPSGESSMRLKGRLAVLSIADGKISKCEPNGGNITGWFAKRSPLADLRKLQKLFKDYHYGNRCGSLQWTTRAEWGLAAEVGSGSEP